MDKELAKMQLEFKERQSNLNRLFILEHKNIFKLLDILLIMAIVFNASCLMLTHALVAKTTPDMVLAETNPVASVAYDFNPAPILEGIAYVWYALIIWAIIAVLYVSVRGKVTSHIDLTWLCAIVSFMIVLNFTNFMSDFGYMFGKWL